MSHFLRPLPPPPGAWRAPQGLEEDLGG